MTAWYRPLTITAEDIANGKQRRLLSCPIALALNDQWGNGASVQACYFRINETHKITPTRTYSLSDAMLAFAFAFDCGRQVYPQTFLYRR